MPLPASTAYLCYDPRDSTQCLSDRATWRHSTNAFLISATMLYTSWENYPMDWDKVATLADLSEEPEFHSCAIRTATLKETNAMLRAALAKRQSDLG